MERLHRTITNRLRLNGRRFTYKLNERLVRLALQFANVSLGRGPSLPGDWKFSRYTVGDFQRCARVLRALCFIHVFARVQAAPFTPACGYKDSLIIVGTNELHKQLRKHTRLSASVVSALVEDLTYGSRGIRFPDPPLQPLMPLLSNRYVIAPHLILNSSMERNFAVLMNRIPEERQIYSGLSSAREQLSRLRIINALSGLRIRHWHGTVQGWGRSSEIDLALMDRTSKSCLLLELKSFVAPAEPREILERSQEIAKGIEQVQKRKRLAVSKPAPLLRVLGIDDGWNLGWAVVAETSVGSASVQVNDVPVVRTGDLIRKIKNNNGLHGIGKWMQSRAYLPTEGEHYAVLSLEHKIAGWTLKWNGVHILSSTSYQRESPLAWVRSAVKTRGLSRMLDRFNLSLYTIPMMRNTKKRPKAAGKSYREGITVMQLLEMFPDEESATKWFEETLWPDERCCGHCGSAKTP